MKSDKTVFRLAAGNLSAAFRRTSGGLSLSELRDTSSGTRFFRGHSPLFFLTARMLPGREEILLRSDEGWSAANAAAAGSACLFTFENHRDVPGVTVLLEAVAERDRIRWTVRLHNARADLTLTECDYPILPFDASPARRVFYPYGCGEVYPSAEPFSIRHSYPSYGVSMQYMAFWDEKKKRGVYFGLHDSAPAFKRLQYEHRPEDPNPFLRASMPLKDVGIPENSQTLEGEAVWELFDGDWFDAASIYKSFALTNASWIPETNPETGYRKDVPDWLRRNPHWWRKRLRESDGFANELLDAAKDLGLSEPSPVHLYDWHQIPYDTNYPHYFPVKDCFITGTEQLHEGGMRFMPYVNGRLWDTHDRGSEDWQFTPVAKPFCVKDESGKPVTETYSTSGVPLAVMCPSAALWQEKQKEIAETLFRPYRADGLYIDQIGAAQPYPCEDRTHSHRPGGGTWWVESYRNLVDHVRRSIPEGGFLTTECTSEPYMKNIQGFLTW
ncbi:MAG: hypothetical protein ILO68_01555, partial [Clostridia bacterium]|nr:hypothetical protein [Clostridia bacterium]